MILFVPHDFAPHDFAKKNPHFSIDTARLSANLA
jgi:hypothetical protein